MSFYKAKALAQVAPTKLPSHPTYHDFSKIQLDCAMLTKDSPGHHYGGKKCTFPKTLHHILKVSHEQGFDDIISWLPHGRSFSIKDKKRFADEVLPRFFEGQKAYASFQRQLNNYGFLLKKKVGPDRNSYYHEKFLRGREDLIPYLYRTRRTTGNKRQSLDPETEPDFYRLPPSFAEDVGQASRALTAAALLQSQCSENPYSSLRSGEGLVSLANHQGFAALPSLPHHDQNMGDNAHSTSNDYARLSSLGLSNLARLRTGAENQQFLSTMHSLPQGDQNIGDRKCMSKDYAHSLLSAANQTHSTQRLGFIEETPDECKYRQAHNLNGPFGTTPEEVEASGYGSALEVSVNCPQATGPALPLPAVHPGAAAASSPFVNPEYGHETKSQYFGSTSMTDQSLRSLARCDQTIGDYTCLPTPVQNVKLSMSPVVHQHQEKESSTQRVAPEETPYECHELLPHYLQGTFQQHLGINFQPLHQGRDQMNYPSPQEIKNNQIVQPGSAGGLCVSHGLAENPAVQGVSFMEASADHHGYEGSLLNTDNSTAPFAHFGRDLSDELVDDDASFAGMSLEEMSDLFRSPLDFDIS